MTHFGTTVDNALSDAANKAKNERAGTAKQVMVMNKYLGIKQFRDPAGRG